MIIMVFLADQERKLMPSGAPELIEEFHSPTARSDNSFIHIHYKCCSSEENKMNGVNSISGAAHLREGLFNLRIHHYSRHQTNSLSSMDGEDMYSNLRVASFSCYLNSADENFTLKLTGGLPDSSSTIISPEKTPRLINSGRGKNNEPEISIFGADKYCNMKSYHANASEYGHEKERSVDLHRPDQNVRPKTPSISSEASSWNSKSAVLQSLRRNASQTKNKRGVGMRFFPIFGCKGPCLDKKGVNISRIVDHGVLHGIQQSQPGLKKVEQFSFPVLKIENVKVKRQLEEKIVLQEYPRNSIDVFGSAMTKKGDIAVNLERKLSILTWDAIPKAQSLVATSFGSSALCDDMASDASSDLFEIENISGTGYSVLSRQESCNMSICMTPTTQYAPSEASIEWSVVTASAADFPSVVSEYEGESVSVAGDIISSRETHRNANPKDSGTKEAPRRGPSRLLGCRSYTAVKVAESTYRTNEKAKGDTNHPFAKRRLSPYQPAGKLLS